MLENIRHSTAFRVLLLALAFTVVSAAACSKKSTTGQTPQKGGTLRVENSEPDSLDANTADDSEQIMVVHQLYRGLIDYDNRTAEVRPAVAERWEPNADATEFTFHLRKDAFFSNGDPVDADAFVRGWSRATSKTLASPVAYHLAGIKGYDAQQKGTSKTLVGVVAVDKYTLKVTLTAPDAEFVVRTGHAVFSPAPADTVIAAQKPSWAEFPIGNGPFMLSEPQKHNQSITMVPNPKFYGAKPFVDKVIYKIIADFDTAYTEWQAGNLDWTRIPGGKFSEAKAQNAGKYVIKPTAGINYLSVNITQKPTNNIDFRKAVSLALDRQAISNLAFAGLQVPATGIIPPVLPGYRKPDSNGVGPCKSARYDVNEAKAELQKAKDAGVDVSKPLLLSFNGGAGHEVWMQAVADGLQKNLGLKTQLKAFQPFSQFIKFRQSKTSNGLMRNAWGMDYPTPDNFLYPLFDSESIGSDNTTFYNNKAFDTLISDARKETDAAKRLKKYQDAEDIVCNDVATVPMWWRTQFRLVDLNKWGGLSMNPFEEPTVETAFQKSTSS